MTKYTSTRAFKADHHVTLKGYTPAVKAFRPDTLVSFKAGYRPTASTLPVVMTVFLSTARETVVLVDGKPRRIATAALTKA